MTFIVWCESNTEGWSRSEDLATMADCFKYIRTETYGHPYVITRPVIHELVEVTTNAPESFRCRCGANAFTEVMKEAACPECVRYPNVYPIAPVDESRVD